MTEASDTQAKGAKEPAAGSALPASLAAPEACLIHRRTGDRYPLHPALTTIGRQAPGLDQTPEAIILADPYLSRQHAQILAHGATYWFVDLDSANGSFINHRRVSGPQTLASGDLLQLGTTALSFELAGEGPQPEEPHV